MSRPLSYDGTHFGCIQGYWGHCFILWMVVKRDERSGKLNEKCVPSLKGVLGSCKHWRQEAESDLYGRLVGVGFFNGTY